MAIFPIVQTASSEPLDQCQIFDDIYFEALDDKVLGIVVTPICDIAQKKANYISFCAIIPFEELFFTRLEKDFSINEVVLSEGKLTRKQQEKIIEFLADFFNGQWNRYHWIGKLEGYEGYWCIDYQIIQSFQTTKIEGELAKRLFKLETPFKESVYVRFANYLGRVGLPVENEERINLAKEVMKELIPSSQS